MELAQDSLAIAVRPNDFDRLGHVNNAAVLELFEAARWRWMERLPHAGASTIVPVVAKIEVEYRRELRAHDVVVETTLLEPSAGVLEDRDEVTYRVVVEQRIVVGGETATRGVVTIAFLDGATRSLATAQDFLFGGAR
jgi:acyl-CoA thioester hydrolase